MSGSVNREGLTYDEWYCAARSFRFNIAPHAPRVAWLAGEDPTEHRASIENKERARIVRERNLP